MVVEHVNTFYKGEIHWKVVSKDFTIVSEGSTKNLIVDASRTVAANAIRGYTGTGSINVFAIGTGNVAPSLSDTQLATELGSGVSRAVLPAPDTDTATAKNTYNSTSKLLTLRQIVSPGVAVSSPGIREVGLFGTPILSDLDTTVNAPTLTSSNTTGGSLSSSTAYEVAYTWSTTSGETNVSNAVSITTGGSDDTITMNSGIYYNNSGSLGTKVQAMPDGALSLNAYIRQGSSGTFYRSATAARTTSPWTAGPTQVAITSAPGSGTAAPAANTSSDGGLVNTGTLFNRALIGEADLTSSDSIIVESRITLG